MLGVGAITPAGVQEALNLPKNIFVHSLVTLGYADEDPKSRPRKVTSTIVFWEKYG